MMKKENIMQAFKKGGQSCLAVYDAKIVPLTRRLFYDMIICLVVAEAILLFQRGIIQAAEEACKSGKPVIVSRTHQMEHSAYQAFTTPPIEPQ